MNIEQVGEQHMIKTLNSYERCVELESLKMDILSYMDTHRDDPRRLKAHILDVFDEYEKFIGTYVNSFYTPGYFD